MANVLTSLAGDLYVAADRVSREQTGFISAVTLNADGSERAAIGDTVRSHFTQASTIVNRTVSMTTSEGTDQTVDNKTVTISNDKAVEIPWTGEDIKHVNNGSGFTSIYGDQIMQAMRALTGSMEAGLANVAYLGASRSYGSAAAIPFATAGDFTDASFVKKILVDNGAPEFGNQLVVNTSAGANITGKQGSVNIAGTDVLQRQGIILPLSGLDIRQSAAVVSHTAGTGASATTDAAGYAIGATVITLAAAGTGTLLTADIVKFAGDTEGYVLASGDANVADGGTITLQEPGLRKAIPAGATAITVTATSSRNICFSRSAIELVARAPAIPVINGVARDSAVDRMMVVDPFSGLPFEVSVYLGQGKAMIQIAVAWGYKVWKPEHVGTLISLPG
jgi:hypothetical protein